jgi:hypothetical protein
MANVRAQVPFVDDDATARALVGFSLVLGLGSMDARAAEGDEVSRLSSSEQVVITGSRLPPAAAQTSQDVRIYEL